MAIADYAEAVMDALVADWAVSQPNWTAVLDVDRDYQPVVGRPTVLVADDGGPAIVPGAWLLNKSPRRTVLRLTAFAAGRTEARSTVITASNFVVTHRPGIARVEDISVPLITRDRDTGAWLASITAPVVVRHTE